MDKERVTELLGARTAAGLWIRGSKVNVHRIRHLPTAIAYYVDERGEYRESYTDVDDVVMTWHAVDVDAAQFPYLIVVCDDQSGQIWPSWNYPTREAALDALRDWDDGNGPDAVDLMAHDGEGWRFSTWVI